MLYLKILARRWRTALIVTVVVFCAAVLGNQLISPTYQAETLLRVVTPLGGLVSETNYETTYALRLINTYAQIATSGKVKNDLEENLNLTSLPSISVDVVPDSEILKIIVKSEDPALAANTANKLADLLVSYQDQAMNSTNSNEVNILANREDKLKAELTQKQSEYDQLVQTYAEKMAEIAVLEGEIQTKEVSYQDLMNQYLQITVSEAVATNSRTQVTKAALSQEMDRIQNEKNVLDDQYKGLLTETNKYSQQIVLARESVRDTQNTYSNLLDQSDIALVNANRQENAKKILIVSPAFEPTRPEGISRRLILGLELIIGIMFGMSSAFILENLKSNDGTEKSFSQGPDR